MKKKRKRGRQSLLNAKLQKQICDLLADANTIKAACGACAISLSTFHEWRNKNPDFSDAVTRARAQARLKLVKEIKRCSCDDWRGWAWLCERMFADEFSRPALLIKEQPAVTARPIPIGISSTTPGGLDRFFEQQAAVAAKLKNLPKGYGINTQTGEVVKVGAAVPTPANDDDIERRFYNRATRQVEEIESTNGDAG